MNLDVNICTHPGCTKRNLPEDKYDAVLQVCLECKKQYYTKFTIEELQKDMFETSGEYKKRINNLPPKNIAKTTLQQYDADNRRFQTQTISMEYCI